MKFGQLIEYNIRNIFVEKLYAECGGETIPRTFSKKLKLSISRDAVKPGSRPLSFTLYKVFLKIKKRPGTSLPV